MELTEDKIEDKKVVVIITNKVPNFPQRKNMLFEYLKQVNPPEWEILFDNNRNELLKVAGILRDIDFFPYVNDLFRAYFLTKLSEVKVVILGQDPYFNWEIEDKLPQATGLAFSVKRGAKLPPTLKNIFIEWNRSLGDKKFPLPKHGDLTTWASQGVLLLNTSLTCARGVSGSHLELWSFLTIRTLELIISTIKNPIFVLWGKPAQKKGNIIKGNNVLYLESSHPSPFSVDRGFKGCNHPKLINNHLKKNGLQPIVWKLPE